MTGPTFHNHFVTNNYYSADNDLILEKLTNLEETMSQLSDAVSALSTRVTEDYGEQIRINGELRALLDQALVTQANDTATIQTLTTQADELTARSTELQGSIDEAVTGLAAIDPDPAFPVNEGEPPAAKRRK